MNTETIESLRGIIQRIIFESKDTGFAIAVMQQINGGNSHSATLSGNLPHITVGDEIKVEGKWVEHVKYGRQFSVVSYMKILPTKADAIEAYLASGMIKGLGPSIAARIVERFGDKTLEVLSGQPDRLMEVPGIGKKKCQTIVRAWKEQMAVTDIMVFLSGCGVTAAYAAKIYRRYGLDSIRVIQENPYQLSYDITGIGFLIADRIARKIGYEENSPQRIKAGTLYSLGECKKEGHVYYPDEILKKRAAELLNVNRKLVEAAMDSLLAEKLIVVEEVSGQRNVYVPSLYKHEKETADTIRRLSCAKSFFSGCMDDIKSQIQAAECKFGVKLSEEQKNAVIKACNNTVSVLTGGPGTGKTLTTQIIVEIFKQNDASILLGAPTGKAAKRLEKCGHYAMTLHRALEYSPQAGGFLRGPDNPLDCQALIVDEMSMADISLFYYLVRSLSPGSHLIIIGDADQLPSVGPGLVLRHLVESKVLPLTVLNQIYRQAEGSGIVQLAHSINKGIVPDNSHFGTDCFFFQKEEPSQAVLCVVELVKKLRAEGVEVQVLSPFRKGEVGTDRINEILQENLNPIPYGQHDTYQVAGNYRKFRINDRVIQTKNDYDRMIFNGDCGIIESIDHDEQQVNVAFEGRGLVSYDFLDLDELSLSYALSVHKSQGSEYDTVISLCMNQHYVMLARNLLYTAVSRAKKRVMIVGTKKAMAIAVRNDQQKARFTRLKERLASRD